MSADARREINNLAVASTDVSQWQITQTEVEYLALVNAARAVSAGDAEVRELRRRFDVFYSRMQTSKVSQAFDGMREIPRVAEALGKIEVALDDLIPVIDAEDAVLVAALPQLTEQLVALQPELRTISLAGVQVFAQRKKNLRGQAIDAMTDLGWISLVLLAVLLGVVGILLALMRSSRRQTSEIALTQNRLQAMISTSIDAVIVVDKHGVVLDYNGAAERIFGYARDEAVGAQMSDLIVPDHMRSAHEAGMKHYRKTGEKRVVGSGLLQLQAKRKNGANFPVELSVASANSEEGEIFVSFVRDISQRMASEQELVEARDKARAGEKAKADLLAVMSHEMRTPLNGVLGTIQLLSETELDDAQKKYVNAMETSGKLLLEHVNDVLDISRVDAGAVEVSKQEFNLPALVEGVVEGLKSQAAERGNLLKVQSSGAPIESVIGDEARVRQILFNLVGNAIKFTENGLVTIEIENQPTQGLVEFRVIDTGIGIDQEDLERIFADFVTLDTSYTREVEGSGLGLGIVKRLVDLLNGEINVESVAGEGTAFSISLPLPEAHHRPFENTHTTGHTAATRSKAKVLLVEDNEINRMVAHDMLSKIGCDVTEAIDGHDGVLLAENIKFDLILMDISMPKVDGVTATQTIKSTNGPNRETPIVALTAHALPNDVARFREAGMIDVITKPLSAVRLLDVLGVSGEKAPSSDMHEMLGQETAIILREKAIKQLKSGFEELDDLISNQNDREKISSVAHQLVGTAAVFELQGVLNALRKVEDASQTATAAELAGFVETARRRLE